MVRRRKDILFLAHVHYPDEVRVRREVDALVSAGYSVDLICLRGPGQPTSESLGALHVIRIPLPKTRRNAATYLWEYNAFFVWAAWRVVWLFAKWHYHLVQVYNQPDYLVFAALVPKVFGTKVIFDYRDAMPEGTMDKYGLSEQHMVVRALRLIEHMAMRFSDGILTVHEPFRRLVVSRGVEPSRTAVFMNLPDPQLFNRAAYPVCPRNLDNGLRLMHHGTLNEVYNVGLILEALALVREKYPDLRVSLKVYGTGPDLAKLTEMAQRLSLENVSFKGRVPLDAIPGIIANEADVGVVPTRGGPIGDFSLSNKLLEYVTMGKPTIASRLPTFREVFGGSSLLLFDHRNAEELAECIHLLASDPNLAKRLVQSADGDLARFSWQANRQRYLDLIARLLQTKRLVGETVTEH